MFRSHNRRFKRSGKRRSKTISDEKMMRTLLLQNQQIIIQQQNMMFMVIKQFQPNSTGGYQHHQNQHQHHQTEQPTGSSQQQSAANHLDQIQPLQPIHQLLNHQHHQASQQAAQMAACIQSNSSSQQQTQHHVMQHQVSSLEEHSLHHQQQQSKSLSQHQQQQDPHHSIYSQARAGTTTNSMDSQHHLQQQVGAHLTDNINNYLTPAASEQDPISDSKHEDEDLAALLEGDGLLGNNLLYNPSTDIGVVTPYKNHSQQQQTPSYYSSGCESLTTPRVAQSRHSTTTNISQNVVKNLADSFKSPSKPKINVQILSGSETKNMKNSKAKIIQRMNISEFLRSVHSDDTQKSST